MSLIIISVVSEYLQCLDPLFDYLWLVWNQRFLEEITHEFVFSHFYLNNLAQSNSPVMWNK